jgi:hypothetical protein
MNREQISKKMSKKGLVYSIEKVQSILDEIDKKAYISARYRKLSDFVFAYCRVFKVAKKCLKEKNDENIQHVFNIDYSDLYVYFNPVKALDSMLDKGLSSNNLGSVHYMLNSKHTSKYCLLPPAVWELINRSYATTMLTGKKAVPEAFSDICNKNSNISRFYDLLKKWNGRNVDAFNKELISRYSDVGEWLEILALANEKKLDARLEHNFLNIKKLFDGSDKIIRTIDDEDLGITLTNVGLDKKTYVTALEKLKIRRPINRSINNKVDAANVALTYDLTKDTENKTYYRFISHSKHVSEAFNDITLDPSNFSDKKLRDAKRGEVDIACCPQLVSLLSLIENNQIKGIGKNQSSEITKFLDDCIISMDKIYIQLDNLKDTRDRYYLEKEVSRLGNDVDLILNNILTPLRNYLKDSNKITKTVYPLIIEHIMNINSGMSKEVNYDAVFPEDIFALERIFKSQETYNELISEVFKSVYEDAETTLDYYEKKFSTGNMQLVMEKIAKQMDN